MQRDRSKRQARALEALLHQVPVLYHRLRAFAQAVHGLGEWSGARRGLLQSLEAGPATVPQLARERLVARQVVQRTVDDLVRDGWLELIDNPHHRRSKLVRITSRGGRMLEQMREREREAARGLFADLPAASLEQARGMLEVLGERLGRLAAIGPASAQVSSPRRRAVVTRATTSLR